jgi:uncharacterized protein
VQPIFVQGSAANSIPLLQRVAVFYNNTVGYSPTLSESISRVISGEPVQPPPADGQQPTPPSGTANVQELLRRADAEYKAAQAELAAGNLAGYQQHINRMAELIRQALGQSGNQGDGASATTTTTTAPPG